MATIGQNTINAKALLGYIERIERLRAERATLNEDIKVIMAEAKAAGFVPAALRYCIKARAMKPHDRQEQEAMRDMYMHAIGLADAGPLFRHVGLMAVDRNAEDQVIGALEQLVPNEGEIILKIGGKQKRLWRDKEGRAHHEDYTPPEPAAEAEPDAFPSPRAAPVPDVDEDGAQALGGEAYGQNNPITANPFPFNDKRRPRWDLGWREASGGDGMGPDDEGKDA